jgi:hypothetical protein
MSERETVVELPFAADCCPCVEKLRTVLPFTVGIRETVRCSWCPPWAVSNPHEGGGAATHEEGERWARASQREQQRGPRLQQRARDAQAVRVCGVEDGTQHRGLAAVRLHAAAAAADARLMPGTTARNACSSGFS